MSVAGEFHQNQAEPRTRAVAMSHLSVEVGHLYLEDLLAGPERLNEHFAEVAAWLRTAEESVKAPKPRISTCFLIDDYFSTDLGDPGEVIGMVTSAAAQAGVRIDYLARESACAHLHGPAGHHSPAQQLVDSLVVEPPAQTTGGRPPVTQSGWLSNGRRSPVDGEGAAMNVITWNPPEQTTARGHSVFVDVELWKDEGQERRWSCALLAAAWQWLRLGLPRFRGLPLTEPEAVPQRWPDHWAGLPGLMRLNDRATPFPAYRTLTVMSSRFLLVEAAVRTVLSQVWPDPEVAELIRAGAAHESLQLPADPLSRIGYVLLGSGQIDPG